MFSIITPLYNKAEYIEKAINSVLTQTYQEFELIVVNDGSTDNGLEIVKKINDSINQRIVVLDQLNSGVSTARNNGVKIAKYDYIAFLDADDWWEDTFLEEMKRLLEAHPNAGIYGSSYYIVKNGIRRLAPIGIEDGFEQGEINYCQVYAKTLCMPLTSISVVMPKRVFVLEKGFKPDLKLGEDFDLWIRIALKFPVILLNKPLVNYNQDVDLSNRAVGGKLYSPHEHMLFTDYGVLNENLDFKYLIDRLSLYSLLPYYLSGKNKEEVKKVLSNIKWEEHNFKYKLQYKIMPKIFIKACFFLLKTGVVVKRKLFR